MAENYNYVTKGQYILLTEQYEFGGKVYVALVDFNMNVAKEELKRLPHDYHYDIGNYLLDKKFIQHIETKWFDV